MSELIPKFSEVSDKYRQAIYRFFMIRTKNAALSEDLTQETFMKAWRHWPPARVKTIQAWLFTIAANSFRDYLRHQKVQSKYQDHIENEISTQPQSSGDITVQISVQEILDLLDAESYEILILREVDGLTIEEVMNHLDLSRDRVRYRLKKAREKFVRLYNKKGL